MSQIPLSTLSAVGSFVAVAILFMWGNVRPTVATGAAAATSSGGGSSNVSAAAATGSSVVNGGGGGSNVSSAAATVAAAASGKFPKLLPGQSTLDEALGTVVKTPAPTMGNSPSGHLRQEAEYVKREK
jgi:hypothetical protein